MANSSPLNANVINPGPNTIFNTLVRNPEFRLVVADRAQKHFFNNGLLTTASCTARYRELVASITNAIVAESARWGRFTRDDRWAPANEYLLNTWFVQRPGIVLQQLQGAGLYPPVPAPLFSHYGGLVAPGFSLMMFSPTGSVYYTLDGSDPRLPGGAISPRVQATIPVILSANTLVRARVLSGTNWSAMTEARFNVAGYFFGLALTEIMYHPPDAAIDGDEFEFLELKNTSAADLDLSGMYFASGVSFAFTNGSSLRPGEFAVLARNAAAFSSKYPTVPVAGVYSGGLANSGETLALAHEVFGQVLSVSYDDDAPWPATADGFGFSIVPGIPGRFNSDRAANWRASASHGGSPGADDPEPTIAPVRIEEILSNGDTNLNYVELFNQTSADIDITGWFLTDDRTTPRKFRIPDTIIRGGGYALFDQRQFGDTNQPAWFSLSSLGGQLHLFSAEGTNLSGYSHGAEFGAAAPGVTFGRHRNSVGDEFFPAQMLRTPLEPNSGAAIGPVVITEIMYNPPDPRDEFLELKNVSASAVALYDRARPTNTWKVDGLAFSFPANVELAAGETLLLTSSDPTFFRERRGIASSVQVFRYAGNLQDSGENLELQRPGTPENSLPYIVIDAVRYNDRLPWPIAADGIGPSLQRRDAALYGNEPTNWLAALATPGVGLGRGGPPEFITQPRSWTAVATHTTTVTAQLTGAEPLFYQWRLNGASIPGGTNLTLLLTNVQPEHGGIYTLMAFNASDAVESSNAVLTVLIPPRITLQPQSQSIFVGSNLTLSVGAQGSYVFDYRWQFNGVDIPGANAPSLTISNIQVEHHGVYTVTVSDPIDSVRSAAAVVAVLLTPAFVQPPLGQSAVVGGNLTLSTMITGHPPPFHYQWRRGAVILTNQMSSNRTAFLTLKNLRTNDAAIYRVIITNLVGRVLVTNFPITVLADSDADGMPDQWEDAYGTNDLDGDLDVDLDGLANRAEYLAGTDPTDPRSVLRFSRMESRNHLLLEFEAVSNRTYAIERSASLAPANWARINDIVASPVNRMVAVTNTLQAPSFYRLRLPAGPDN